MKQQLNLARTIYERIDPSLSPPTHSPERLTLPLPFLLSPTLRRRCRCFGAFSIDSTRLRVRCLRARGDTHGHVGFPDVGQSERECTAKVGECASVMREDVALMYEHRGCRQGSVQSEAWR